VDAIEALCWIQIEEADSLVERLGAFVAESPDRAMLYGALGYAYGLNGQYGKATEILKTMTHPGAHSMKDEFYAIGLVLLGLNRKQEAVNCFERTYRDGLLWSLGFRSDPILATLQDDPHYQTFMSRVTFPEPEIADPKLGLVG
jgi:tetratricopeptide (TPR) repeat protein